MDPVGQPAARAEAAFGIMKGTTTGGIRRGWMKQFGLVRTGLLLAVAIAATNLTSLLRWSDQTGDTRDELTTYDVTDYGFAEYDENGNLPEPGAPPGG